MDWWGRGCGWGGGVLIGLDIWIGDQSKTQKKTKNADEVSRGSLMNADAREAGQSRSRKALRSVNNNVMKRLLLGAVAKKQSPACRALQLSQNRPGGIDTWMPKFSRGIEFASSSKRDLVD